MKVFRQLVLALSLLTVGFPAAYAATDTTDTTTTDTAAVETEAAPAERDDGFPWGLLGLLGLLGLAGLRKREPDRNVVVDGTRR